MLVGVRVGRPCVGYGSRLLVPLQSFTAYATSPQRLSRISHRYESWSFRRQYSTPTPDTEQQRPVDDANIINEHSQLHVEANARQARLQYGASLPDGMLSPDEYKVYERLYGAPVSTLSAEEKARIDRSSDPEAIAAQDEAEAASRQVLVSEENEVIEEEDEEEPFEEDEEWEDDEEDEGRMTERQKAEEAYWSMEEASGDHIPRTHPLTLEGRFADSRSSIVLPADSISHPTSKILGQLPNKHLTEMAQKTFGRWLEDSAATPSHAAHRHLQQKPPPLVAAMSSMTATEAGIFMACNQPGMYASISTALVETRKRLGSSWIESLLNRRGGPRVLDVGSAGAAVHSWREILRAEWERLHPNPAPGTAYPKGKSTIVVGASELRERIAELTTDTTFLPRVPDFSRQRDLPGSSDKFAPGARKHYDVIVATHSLWPFHEDYQRRELVQNLWSLLDPSGGVLLLLEKGVPRGFEHIAGARRLLLKYHIASPSDASATSAEDATGDAHENRHVRKETGMIVAPCTNHGPCPLAPLPGAMQGRKDHCRFGTRFERPPYLKRLLGTRARDEERIRFSYIAVQRGKDLRADRAIPQDEAATRAALAGYEHLSAADLASASAAPSSNSSSPSPVPSSPPSPSPVPHVLSLPRLILPPLKRHGHVVLDVCTPAATIERWVLPKSRSRQGYRDARKARWGDLWALGAKSRATREVRTGRPGGLKARVGRKGRTGPREREEGEMVWPV